MLIVSRQKAAILHANLTGGLPFEAKKNGEPRKPRPLTVRKRTPKGKRVVSPAQAHKEDDHLRSFFNWTRQHEREYPRLGGRLCFHTANEGALLGGGREGAQRTLKGVKAGVLDVLNLRPSRGFSYFAGELKVIDGENSPEQSEFITQARSEGAFAHTFWCFSELCRAMMWYFCINDRLVYLSAGDPRDYLLPDLGGHDERCGCNVKLADLIVYENRTVFLRQLRAAETVKDAGVQSPLSSMSLPT
jgi:hypothetical protein